MIKNTLSGNGLYRSQNGFIFGVFAGLADYFGFSVFWIRTIAVILLILTGLWPITGVYLVAALIMKTDPGRDFRASRRNHSCGRYAFARYETPEWLKRKWRRMENRIRRMEDRVTSREFDWENRYRG